MNDIIKEFRERAEKRGIHFRIEAMVEKATQTMGVSFIHEPLNVHQFFDEIVLARAMRDEVFLAEGCEIWEKSLDKIQALIAAKDYVKEKTKEELDERVNWENV